MPIYEFYCSTCKSTFEKRLPMSMATTPTDCTAGHSAERTVSQFAVATLTRDGGMDEAPSGGGGCCGGACGCSN